MTARKNPDLRDVLVEGNDADGQDVTNVGSLQIIVPETGDYPDAPFRLSLPDDFADNADWGVILRIGPADDPNPAHALFSVDAFGGLVFRALLGQGAFPLMRLTSQDDPSTYLVAGPRGLQMSVQTADDFDQEVLGIGTVADGFIFDVEKDGSVFFNGSLYFQRRAIPVALTSGSKLSLGFDDTDGAVKLKIVATSADGTNVATDIPIGDDIATQADIAAEASARATDDAGKQPLDPDLTAFAALDSSTAGVAATDGSGWIKKTYAQFKTALGLSTADVPDSTDKRYVTDAQRTVIGNTSGTNTGDQSSVTGNAGTATKLATARNIDGQSFDGSAAIMVVAPGTHAATSKATPVDADELPLADSAASFVLKKLTWANLKATIKAYTDTLYPSGSGTSTGTNTGDQTSVSGNAGTATALQTARAIDGQNFDGSAAITVIAPGTHAATGKTTPVDADELPLVDSAASNVLKKLTWANLKATLKTYFDTLYATAVPKARLVISGVTQFSIPGVQPTQVQSTFTLSANRAMYFPFVVETPITIDQIIFELTTGVAASTCRAAIYNADSSWQPTSLVANTDTGALATAAANQGVIATTITDTVLAPGRYLFWLNASTGNPVFRCVKGYVSQWLGYPVAMGGVDFSQVFIAQTYGAPPSTGLTYTGSSTSGSSGPFGWPLFLRVKTP